MSLDKEVAEKGKIYLQDSRVKTEGLQGVSENRETRQGDGM